MKTLTGSELAAEVLRAYRDEAVKAERARCGAIIRSMRLGWCEVTNDETVAEALRAIEGEQ